MEIQQFTTRYQTLKQDQQKIAQYIQNLKAELEQKIADYNAFDGAIQECEYWIKELKNKAAQKKEEEIEEETLELPSQIDVFTG